MARMPTEASHDTKKETETAIGSLDDFLTTLSDELRKPLRSLLSAVSALTCESTMGADLWATLAMIRHHVEWQGRLIDDILAYSRVGTRGAAFQTTDCGAALERALANLRPSIDQTGAVVTHDPLPSLWADGTQMTQLFETLIGNAIKFRDEAPPRIHVAAERHCEEWVFAIRDNGIGFDPKHAEQIFTIFHRLHDADECSGTGIGLAICKKIVERHAGRIWVESEPGRGSRFFFTIPARANGQP